MSYLKNTASQKVAVFAINAATTLPVTGDAGNITAKISKDFAASASLSDTNPVELDATDFAGVYVFDLTQSETDADIITLHATSTTANVQMDIINISTVDLDSYKADTSALATSAQISALNDFDPSTDSVALVDLCTSNTDMRGTDNAALASSLSITNSSVNTIKTDTGTTIPAQISALNDFDPSTDSVALVDVCTSNTDMRGTDNAATAISLGVVDGKCSSILTDTGTTIPAQITALNDFDPATDAVALVDLCTSNTDMRGTDNAALASSLSITNANVNTIKTVTDVIPDSGTMTSMATRANQITIDGKADDIKAKTDQMVFTVANQIDANALTGGGGGGGSSTAALVVQIDAENSAAIIRTRSIDTPTAKLVEEN